MNSKRTSWFLALALTRAAAMVTLVVFAETVVQFIVTIEIEKEKWRREVEQGSGVRSARPPMVDLCHDWDSVRPHRKQLRREGDGHIVRMSSARYERRDEDTETRRVDGEFEFWRSDFTS